MPTKRSTMTTTTMLLYVVAAVVWAGPLGAASAEQSFAVEPSDRTAVVDGTVSLPCRVAGLAGQLQWTKDDFALGTSRNLSNHGYPRYTMTGGDATGESTVNGLPHGTLSARVPLGRPRSSRGRAFARRVSRGDGRRRRRRRTARVQRVIPARRFRRSRRRGLPGSSHRPRPNLRDSLEPVPHDSREHGICMWRACLPSSHDLIMLLPRICRSFRRADAIIFRLPTRRVKVIVVPYGYLVPRTRLVE